MLKFCFECGWGLLFERLLLSEFFDAGLTACIQFRERVSKLFPVFFLEGNDFICTERNEMSFDFFALLVDPYLTPAKEGREEVGGKKEGFFHELIETP